MSANLLWKTRILSCKRCLVLQLSFQATKQHIRIFSNVSPSKSNIDTAGGGGGDREDNVKFEKYAYGMDQFSKKDKNAPGLFHLPTIHLPKQLDTNLKEYLKRYPRKMLENDGRKLSKHLRNRGRPTEMTWKKYKESKASKRLKDSAANIDEIMKLKSEQENSQVTIAGDEYDLDEDDAEVQNKNLASDEDNQGDEDTSAEQVSEKRMILNTKKPRNEEYKVIRYDVRESTAFGASRIPASYGATLRVIHEISRREPDYKPETLMDFGSGTGTVLWAAHEKWGDSIKEYQCIDVSEPMNTLSEFLLRGGESYKKPLHIPHVYYKRFLPVSNKVTYDVVIASYTLSEIPHLAMRREAIKSLWAKTNDFLVLIEYGNNEGFELLLQARQMIEKDQNIVNENRNDGTETESSKQGQETPFEDDIIDEGFVFAPCPHDQHCPRADIETRDHPCNFEQQVQLSLAEKRTSLKKWGFVTECFSYLVLKKGRREESDKSWPRILEPIKLKRRHLICKICSSNGELQQKTLTKKKDSDIYKCVRHLNKWGDLLAMPQDRVRPLKNPERTTTRRGKPRK
ncbi:methyltransferase-like protein 17, mitochondrial [Actinia tenebrosa]|uniref:Methyltransferase-like protein 17, mitochondrial n=1 Tax=Actinia tenebrosa TaxID=6105 RepID=A0A6P8HTK1_ACTTE|nr:methyltransferase-like protein 17, mitochondrial [Actinia tenebrosa]